MVQVHGTVKIVIQTKKCLNPKKTERENAKVEGNEKGRIEAILFVAGNAVEIRELSKALNISTARGCLPRAV